MSHINKMSASLAMLLVLPLVGGCLSGGDGQPSPGDSGVETHGEIEFMTSYEAAKQRAIEEDKPLLV